MFVFGVVCSMFVCDCIVLANVLVGVTVALGICGKVGGSVGCFCGFCGLVVDPWRPFLG